MKRFWLGAILLALLLGVGLWTGAAMDRIHSPMAQALEEAAQAAQADRWEEAGRLARSAQGAWEQHRSFTASLADHTPMEEVDGLFARLSPLLAERETGEFAALCRELAQKTRAMSQAHSASWWNFL